MKTKFFLFIFILTLNVQLLTFNCLGQEQPAQYKNELRLDAIQLFKSTFMLTFERTLNDKSSIQLSGGIILKENESEQKRGGIVEVQYRLNRSFKKIIDSSTYSMVVYAGPFLRYRYIDATSTSYFYYTNSLYENNNYYYNKLYYFSTISGGALVGIKFSLFKYIFIDMSFGGGIKFTETNGYKTSTILDDAYTGVTPVGSLSFGFKF
ncbi:MAG: hypothetical protein HY958_03970 [Bacteroidia bacterium]|nr:hypothetical protein [Bacteroidia bacterium]